METKNQEEKKQKLKENLGLSESVAIGVGGTIGGGIFILIGVASGYAGPGVILSFVLAFIASLLVGLCYAELAARLPFAGGGYTFAQVALGDKIGYVMGWGYWGSYIAASGYVTLGFGAYLEYLTGIPQMFGAVALILSVLILNILGTQISGFVQKIIVLLIIITLLTITICGIPHIHTELYRPFFPKGLWGVISASVLAFLSFGGFDIIAAAGEEIKNPAKTIPIAIFMSLIIVLILYLFTVLVSIGIIPWEQLSTLSAPLSNVSLQIFGLNGPIFIDIVALISTAATANAVLVVTSRIVFAMARDKLLPEKFAYVNTKRNTPIFAILISAFFMILLAIAGSVSIAANVTGFLYVIHFVYDIIALVVLRKKDNKNTSEIHFKVPFFPVISIITILMLIGILITIKLDGFIIGLIWILIGVLYKLLTIK